MSTRAENTKWSMWKMFRKTGSLKHIVREFIIIFIGYLSSTKEWKAI